MCTMFDVLSCDPTEYDSLPYRLGEVPELTSNSGVIAAPPIAVSNFMNLILNSFDEKLHVLCSQFDAPTF